MTKIAIDCRLIGQSGIGTYIENIIHHAVKMEGFEFTLVGDTMKLKPYADCPNCCVVNCLYGSFSWKELLRFPVKEVNKCDAFFTPNFNIPTGIKVPIFCTIHDVVFFDVEGICSRIGKIIRWLYIKRALKISKRVFTVSDFSKERIKKIFHYDADMPVIYNGISQELINYRQNHPQSTKGDYIVCLGNLKKYKGVRDLITAYQQALSSKMINYKLYIIGRIDFRTNDEEIAKLLKHKNEQIVFVTDADNTKVYELLAGAQALVSPSRYEGFGIPPLEAMYLHTPALISDIPTYKEIYKETPVKFFRNKDITDLVTHLQQLPNGYCDIDSIVEDKYSYQKTAQSILHHIKDTLQQ